MAAIRKFFKEADMFLLGTCLVATAYGMVLISSATRKLPGGAGRYLLVQGIAVGLGILLFILFSALDLDVFSAFWKWLFLFSVLIILLLIPFGEVRGGNKSWLAPAFLPFAIQPAEIAKIPFIILLAKQMYWLRERINRLDSVLMLLGYTGFMVGLIVFVSDDLGVGLIYVAIFLCMAVASNLKFYWFLIGAGLLGGSFPLIWQYVLGDVQRARIIAGFNPESDPQDRGWQAIQSKIALGGGKMFGTGLYNGPQTQFSKNLPNQQTDFIFSVAGEELGMVGCLGIIVLLLIIIGRCLFIALRAKNGMSALVCVGVAGMMIFQTFINIGMCIGLTPVIGLTLPFFSYGGSSLLSLYAAMGLVSGVRMRPMPSWIKDRANE